VINSPSRSVPAASSAGPAPRRGRIRPAAAAAAAAVLTALPVAAASCASPPPSGAAGSSSGSCASPGVSASTIKVGLIYPDSGGVAADAFEAVRAAVNARISAQNAAGGVHGRQIEVVLRDDRSDPATFAYDASNLVSTEKVFGLIVESIAAGPTMGTLTREDIPVTGVAVGVDPSKYHNLFSFSSLFTSTGTTAVDTFGRYVQAQGGTRALVLSDPTAPTSATVAAQYAPSMQSQGVAVVGQSTYTAGATSPAQIVAELRHSGADALVGALQPNDFADVYAAAKAAGLNLRVALNAAGYGQDLLRSRGKEAAGMSVIVGYTAFETNSPAVSAYHQAMATYSPELGDPDQEAALASYVSADEIVHGLDLAGACPTRDGFITALHGLPSYTAGGLIAPTNLGDPGAPATCFTFVKANAAGTAFAPVAPPTTANGGFWCGRPVTS
jgi:ABC-type branched-subunit amino acid transport system substrate-binding protein